METYDKYKPSGIDWIGEVPEHWEIKKVSWLFTIGSGTTPSTSNKEYYAEEGINWLQTGDLNDGVIRQTSKKITQKALDDCRLTLYPSNSLVVAMYGATIGKVGLLDIETTTNQACCVLYNSKVNTQFAYYTFLADKTNLITESYGGGQPNISQEKIKSQRIACPPLAEQEAIAAYLDARCADIDKVVATQEKRIALLQELKQSEITQAVTRGLNPDARMKDSGVEWIGMVPEHWEKCRFKDFITLVTKPSLSETKIGLENIESGTGRFIETDSEFEGNGVEFFENDVVYGKLRPYLQKVWLATFKGNAVGDFFVFREKKNSCSHYLKYLMLSDGFTKEADGATVGAKMPRVSSDFILTMRYYLPNRDEQVEIAEYLDRRCGEIDKQIGAVTKQIELLREYKQALITEVVTGKRRV